MPDIPSAEAVKQRLKELNQLAIQAGVSGKLILSGGSALQLIYHIPRATKDIDYVRQDMALADFMQQDRILSLGFQVVESSLFMLHPDFMDTLQPFDLTIGPIQIYTLDAYNLILSKLDRFASHDKEDILYICRNEVLDPNHLIAVYEEARQYYLNPRRADFAFRDIMDEVFGRTWQVPER